MKFVLESVYSYEIENLQQKKDDTKLKGKAKENYILKIDQKINELIEKRNALLTKDVPTDIDIEVEWKKSKTWGRNPKAECIVRGKGFYKTYRAEASGCGYDKYSAAVASCLNQCDEVRALLVQNAEILNQHMPYGIAESFGFMGGVGINCFNNIFRLIGYNVQELNYKSVDVLVIRKKD